MIFAILGIVILVVSFVIALVTLVREQRRIDDAGFVPPGSDKGAVAAITSEKELSDPQAAHKIEELSPHSEPLETLDTHKASGAILQEASAGLEGAVAVGTLEEKSHVWWERLAEGEDSLYEKNEDEKSIEEIREELAKLMSTKTNVVEEKGLAVENRQESTQRGLGSATLPVEFSPREIKKKD